MHKNGRVILDGEVIQQNGVFVDPDLAILNPKFPSTNRENQQIFASWEEIFQIPKRVS